MRNLLVVAAFQMFNQFVIWIFVSGPAFAETTVPQELRRSVTLTWEEIDGASAYEYEISSSDVKGFSTLSEKIQTAQFKGKLTPGNYQFRIRSYDDRSIAGEWSNPVPFHVAGQLEPPKIQEVNLSETPEVSAISWEANEDAKVFTYKLVAKVFDRKGNLSAEKILSQKTSVPQKKIQWKKKLPPGEYSIEVKAEGAPWVSSELAKYSFVIPVPPPRKPAFTPDLSSETRLRRDWSHNFIATYLATGISYSSQSPGLARHPETKAQTVGGTGRLGYRYEPEGKTWGITGLLDYSGFIVESRNNTFASGEILGHYTRRTEFNQLRIGAGLFYKQLPYLLVDDTDQLSYDRIGYFGPMAFFDYRQFGAGKHGFKFEGSIYRATQGTQVPNGKSIDPTSSYEVGFGGTYAFSPRGFFNYGVSQRFDHIYFGAVTTAEDPTSLAVEGDKNEVSLTGSYVKLSIEFGF